MQLIIQWKFWLVNMDATEGSPNRLKFCLSISIGSLPDEYVRSIQRKMEMCHLARQTSSAFSLLKRLPNFTIISNPYSRLVWLVCCQFPVASQQILEYFLSMCIYSSQWSSLPYKTCNKLQKVLELPSDSASASIRSQAIKTASLDHITKPSVLSSSPPECLLCRYETSWNEEKETQWPVRRKKGKGREGEGTRWELAVDRLCNVLCSAIGWARRPRMSAHFMQTFHCSPAAIATETKPPQQLCYCWMAAKGVPGAGLERARWVEWLIRSKLLYEMHIVTQIR